MQVVIPPTHLAPAISFMYLSTTIFLTIGLPISNAAMQSALIKSLTSRLLELDLTPDALHEVRFPDPLPLFPPLLCGLFLHFCVSDLHRSPVINLWVWSLPLCLFTLTPYPLSLSACPSLSPLHLRTLAIHPTISDKTLG